MRNWFRCYEKGNYNNRNSIGMAVTNRSSYWLVWKQNLFLIRGPSCRARYRLHSNKEVFHLEHFSKEKKKPVSCSILLGIHQLRNRRKKKPFHFPVIVISIAVNGKQLLANENTINPWWKTYTFPAKPTTTSAHSESHVLEHLGIRFGMSNFFFVCAARNQKHLSVLLGSTAVVAAAR